MPDFGFAALAIVGAVALAGGGGWMYGLLKGRRGRKNSEEE